MGLATVAVSASAKDRPLTSWPMFHSQDSTPALHDAVTGGDLKKLRKLLDRGADPDVEHPEHGTTALTIACSQGRAEMVDELLKHGADVNKPHGKGSGTPLMLAATSQKVNVVRILLTAGADVNTQDEWGGTALSRAMACGNEPIITMLRDKGAEFVPFLKPTSLDTARKVKTDLSTVVDGAEGWRMQGHYDKYVSDYRPTWKDVEPYVLKLYPAVVRKGLDLIGNPIGFGTLSERRAGYGTVYVSWKTIRALETFTGDEKQTREFWGEYYPPGPTNGDASAGGEP